MDPYSYSVAALNGFGLSGGRRIFLNEAARQAYIRRLKTRYLKTTRKGKIFYGCDNYPKCKTATWDIPTGKLCPICNSMLINKNNLTKCSNCDYAE